MDHYIAIDTKNECVTVAVEAKDVVDAAKKMDKAVGAPRRLYREIDDTPWHGYLMYKIPNPNEWVPITALKSLDAILTVSRLEFAGYVEYM